MTPSKEAALLPCPFCGKSVASITSASELSGEDFYEHSESYAVMCDASAPNGPGGCGGSGGFFPTEAQAISAWNRRSAIAAPEAAQNDQNWQLRDGDPFAGDGK